MVPRPPFLVTRDTDSVGQSFVHAKKTECGQATQLHALVRIKLNKIISRTYQRTRSSAGKKKEKKKNIRIKAIKFNSNCRWKPLL